MSEAPQSRTLQRDRPDSSFSHILAAFLQAQASVLAAVFVDGEGECIDYAAYIEPDEAKVFGAALLGTTAELARASTCSASGAPVQWVLQASRYDFVVRRLSCLHVVVVVLEGERLSGHLLRAMSSLGEALRIEAGLAPAPWDLDREAFTVDVGPGEDGAYVPLRVRQGTRAITVERVLGRWTERGTISPAENVCFRVRTAGEDLTLVHEPALSRWHRR